MRTSMARSKPKTSKNVAPRENKHTLSRQLRDVIESRGLTAYALGKEADVDATVVGRFLSGERDLRLATADRLATALGLRLVEVARQKRRGLTPGAKELRSPTN
jgi:transcriptional regulator with XRE-family HTH domain